MVPDYLVPYANYFIFQRSLLHMWRISDLESRKLRSRVRTYLVQVYEYV